MTSRFVLCGALGCLPGFFQKFIHTLAFNISKVPSTSSSSLLLLRTCLLSQGIPPCVHGWVKFWCWSWIWGRLSRFLPRRQTPFCRIYFYCRALGHFICFQSIFSLLQQSFTMFCDSCSALQILGNFLFFSSPGVSLSGVACPHGTLCWYPGQGCSIQCSAYCWYHPYPEGDLRPHINEVVCSCWQDRWDVVGAHRIRDVHQQLGA